MSDKVVQLNCVTKLDIPVDNILNSARDNELENCIVVGWDKDEKFYFASSMADGAEVNWLLDLAKHYLFKTALEDDDE